MPSKQMTPTDAVLYASFILPGDRCTAGREGRRPKKGEILPIAQTGTTRIAGRLRRPKFSTRLVFC